MLFPLTPSPCTLLIAAGGGVCVSVGDISGGDCSESIGKNGLSTQVCLARSPKRLASSSLARDEAKNGDVLSL